MRILEIVAGIILLGGAAWATVRTYKGHGKSSWAILLFAIFLVALGLYFLVDAVGAYLREFRIGSEWIK
jgi:ABC-type transport system involved in cytochrome c biogenesis permease subunit